MPDFSWNCNAVNGRAVAAFPDSRPPPPPPPEATTAGVGPPLAAEVGGVAAAPPLAPPACALTTAPPDDVVEVVVEATASRAARRACSAEDWRRTRCARSRKIESAVCSTLDIERAPAEAEALLGEAEMRTEKGGGREFKDLLKSRRRLSISVFF